ncbi:MAG TPA: hypothetical protein VJ837_01685, partial [Candidatus Paceibacterota bacterium]|nr:hypothetical protein [Candidatus Paceibacterota bacterium]
SSVSLINITVQMTPRGASDKILNEVVESIRRDISLGASLYQTADSTYHALLPETDTAAALAVARRVRDGLRILIGKHASLANVIVGVASAPSDGVEIQSLLIAAKDQVGMGRSSGRPSSIH